MAPLRKHVTNATADAPVTLKGKGKTIEAPEPADHQPNPSDVHISNTEDSRSNSASPREMQAVEPKP